MDKKLNMSKRLTRFFSSFFKKGNDTGEVENQVIEGNIKKYKNILVIAGILVAGLVVKMTFFHEPTVTIKMSGDDSNNQNNTVFGSQKSTPNWQEFFKAQLDEISDKNDTESKEINAKIDEKFAKFQEVIQQMLDSQQKVNQKTIKPSVTGNTTQNIPSTQKNKNNPQNKIIPPSPKENITYLKQQQQVVNPLPPKLNYGASVKKNPNLLLQLKKSQSSHNTGANTSQNPKGSEIVLIQRKGELPPVEEKIDDAHKGVILPGAFADITLLSGIDAITGDVAKENPQPILLRLTTNFSQPAMIGKSFFKTKGCLIIGSAIGDVSASRLYVSPTRISCVYPDKRYMLSGTINGYITDIDSKLGLMGEVQHRTGAVIYQSLIASSVSGLTKALSTVSAAQLASSVNNGSSLDLNLLGSSALMGAGSEVGSQIADIYKNQFESIYPVIVIPAFVNGKPRTGNIVIQNLSQLKWEKY